MASVYKYATLVPLLTSSLRKNANNNDVQYQEHKIIILLLILLQ